MTMYEIIQDLDMRFRNSNGEPIKVYVNDFGLNNLDGNCMTLSLIPIEGDEREFADHLDSIKGYAGIRSCGEGIANVMGGTMLEFLSHVEYFESYRREYQANLDRCRAYAEAHRDKDPEEEGDGPISFYQEWHKNLLGFKPWGWEFNIRHEHQEP